LVHHTLTGGLLYLVQQGGNLVGGPTPQSLPSCTKCNIHPVYQITFISYGTMMCTALKGVNRRPSAMFGHQLCNSVNQNQDQLIRV